MKLKIPCQIFLWRISQPGHIVALRLALLDQSPSTRQDVIFSHPLVYPEQVSSASEERVEGCTLGEQVRTSLKMQI